MPVLCECFFNLSVFWPLGTGGPGPAWAVLQCGFVVTGVWLEQDLGLELDSEPDTQHVL